MNVLFFTKYQWAAVMSVMSKYELDNGQIII